MATRQHGIFLITPLESKSPLPLVELQGFNINSILILPKDVEYAYEMIQSGKKLPKVYEMVQSGMKWHEVV